MKLKHLSFKREYVGLSLLLGLALPLGMNGQESKQPDAFEPSWMSLRKHHTPEWFDGLKLGIYCHWGFQAVQTQFEDEELSRLEAIERWKGENFDAKEWVDLFQAAGAQFGGPVAWHGSGILNWDSDLTDWDSVEKGPGIDIYGDLAAELRERDMKVINSFHTNNIWGVMWGRMAWDNETHLDPREDNSAYATSNQGRIGDDIFDSWFDRISEAIHKYQPDMVWLDTGFGSTVGKHLKGHAIEGRLLPDADNEVLGIREAYQKKLIAHYFNKGLEWGKEVEVIYKTFDLPPGVGVRDIENGSLVGLQYDPWMADINLMHHDHYPAPWFYNPKNRVKSANHLVDLLVDMVSKNGRILLNVPPKPDGTFSEEIKLELYGLGDWLKVNGEAIYDTMPWHFFGEGPTEETYPGHHAHGKWGVPDKHIPNWTKEDIRFTQNEEALYAIVMDWPGEELRIRTLGSRGKLYPGEIESVSLLGHDGVLEWEHTPDALLVKMPEERPCEHAFSLKVVRR
ncbi:alpha-L-fucosidase [Pelagicoccus mobilis]|uniref:alpha-L-fucosidase n=1 Tax=Pelagicoccus mobilis TaxID=415221 RepID=A0A934S306_9BACT|nr:alpha-L-fucosidase [Pelagicoccus mobilis]MBK1879721.1 alpha-L-fucosidase [Pelagicoccus mobilis]